MVSIIKVTSVQDTSGNNETTTENIKKSFDGAAKAWFHFNGTGTAAIDESFNGSSLTDHGTGEFSLYMTSSMNTDNYVVSSSGGHTTVNDFHTIICVNAYSTGNFRIAVGYVTHASHSRADRVYNVMAVHGDLA